MLYTRQMCAVLAVTFAATAMIGAAEQAAPQWPQFNGPKRDNKSTETGLLKRWPDGGPKLLWTTRGIGEGYSAVAVAGGLVYTTGNVGRDTVITALGLDGKVTWRVKNGPAYSREKPGTRSTPTIDAGRLYHMNSDGDLVCLDATSGKAIWSVNILTKFDGRNIRWGLAESLLIDGRNVICTPGGKEISLAALDKRTGQTVWVCKGAGDKPGYCSPIAFTHKGLRQIVTLMSGSVVGVHAQTGKLLWQVRQVTPFDENIASPIFHDGHVFASTRSTGSKLLKVIVEGPKASVKQVWHTRAMDNQHGGVLLLGGHLYGSCLTSRSGPWACLEFKTGKQTHRSDALGRASSTYADGMLYLLNHRRTVALVSPSPRASEIVSRFTIPKGGRGPTWAHPVVCGGRLYIRHGDYLYAYDIRAKQ